MAGVLDGIRVLDFGRYIAGPFCAALLGDLGAEVIRIERLGGGGEASRTSRTTATLWVFHNTMESVPHSF